MENVVPFHRNIKVIPMGICHTETLRVSVACILPEFPSKYWRLSQRDILLLAERHGYIPFPPDKITHVLAHCAERLPKGVEMLHLVQRKEFQKSEGECHDFVITPDGYPNVPVAFTNVTCHVGVAFCFMKCDALPRQVAVP